MSVTTGRGIPGDKGHGRGGHLVAVVLVEFPRERIAAATHGADAQAEI